MATTAERMVVLIVSILEPQFLGNSVATVHSSCSPSSNEWTTNNTAKDSGAEGCSGSKSPTNYC